MDVMKTIRDNDADFSNSGLHLSWSQEGRKIRRILDRNIREFFRQWSGNGSTKNPVPWWTSFFSCSMIVNDCKWMFIRQKNGRYWSQGHPSPWDGGLIKDWLSPHPRALDRKALGQGSISLEGYPTNIRKSTNSAKIHVLYGPFPKSPTSNSNSDVIWCI